MRLEYPAAIKVIRIPCTGKIDLIHLLRAFEKGADGAYVVGCLEGSCQFVTGNLQAKKRVDQVKQILDAVGVGGDRVAMYNLSSGEGTLFAEYAGEMYEKIRELGPNPIKLNMKNAKKKAAA